MYVFEDYVNKEKVKSASLDRIKSFVAIKYGKSTKWMNKVCSLGDLEVVNSPVDEFQLWKEDGRRIPNVHRLTP